jgi:hypothetical protein
LYVEPLTLPSSLLTTTCTHPRTQPFNLRKHSSNADFRAGEVHRIIGAGGDGELASLAGDQLHQLSAHSEKPSSSVHECGLRCVECLLLYSHGLVTSSFSRCSSFNTSSSSSHNHAYLYIQESLFDTFLCDLARISTRYSSFRWQEPTVLEVAKWENLKLW